MLRKYTRANLKLFGLKFNEQLFGGRAVREAKAICPSLTNAGPANGEQATRDDFGSGRRLRRRRRETH